MASFSFSSSSSSQSSPFSLRSSTASAFSLGPSTASPFFLGPSTGFSVASSFSSTPNRTSTFSFTNPQNASFASSPDPFGFASFASSPASYGFASFASSPAPSFGFGSSSSSTPSLVPSFGFASSSSLATSSTNPFGFVISSSSASSTTVAQSPSPGPASSPFGFGSAPSSANSGSYLFGSLASTTSSSTPLSFPNLSSSTITITRASTLNTASTQEFPAFNVYSSSAFTLPSTAQSASTMAPSGTISSFASSAVAGSLPSISLPTKSTVPASSEAQSTTPAPVFSVPFILHTSSAGCSAREEVIQGEDDQLRNEVVKQPKVEPVEQKAVEGLISVIRVEKNQRREVFDLEIASVQESVGSTSALVSGSNSASTPTAITPTVDATVATTMTPEPRFASSSSVGPMPSGENVEGGKETAPINVKSESDAAASVVAKRSKAGVCGVGTQTLPLVFQHIDVNDYLTSPEHGLIVKRILEKYGDITSESILKSMAAKFVILDLVADAVCRLCSHTIKTLGPDDVQLIEANTEDAVAVGFNVEWLRERLDKVILARNYQVRLTEMEKLEQDIEITKKSLAEMEHRHMDLKMVVAAIKDEMEVIEAGGSSLGEGLL